MQRLINSFKHAFSGIKWVFKDHPNFRIHAIVATAVVIAAVLLRFSTTELAILVLTILFVLTSEMINTSVEEVTNLITVKWTKQAKVAKDISAGMVLVSAIGSVIIGILLFGAKLF